MSQCAKCWNQNLNPDNLILQHTSLHTKKEQAGMEILIFLLKLSSIGFSCWGDIPKIRKKECPIHSNLDGNPDNWSFLTR